MNSQGVIGPDELHCGGLAVAVGVEGARGAVYLVAGDARVAQPPSSHTAPQPPAFSVTTTNRVEHAVQGLVDNWGTWESAHVSNDISQKPFAKDAALLPALRLAEAIG